MHPDDAATGTYRSAQLFKNIFPSGYPFCRFGVKERRQTGACGKEKEENIVENDPQELDFYMGTNVKVNG